MDDLFLYIIYLLGICIVCAIAGFLAEYYDWE